MSFLDLMIKGGWTMVPILIVSVVGVAVIWERLLVLRRGRQQADKHITDIRSLLDTRQTSDVYRFCIDHPSPVTNILRSALQNYQRSHYEIRQAVDAVGQLEAAKLEKNMSVLYTCASVAPLLGFLGTVLGMITAFQQIQALGGNVNASVLAGGIWEALITTVAGLVVSIPLLIAHNYLTGSIDTFVLNLEEYSLEMMDLVLSHKERS